MQLVIERRLRTQLLLLKTAELAVSYCAGVSARDTIANVAGEGKILSVFIGKPSRYIIVCN